MKDYGVSDIGTWLKDVGYNITLRYKYKTEELFDQENGRDIKIIHAFEIPNDIMLVVQRYWYDELSEHEHHFLRLSEIDLMHFAERKNESEE